MITAHKEMTVPEKPLPLYGVVVHVLHRNGIDENKWDDFQAKTDDDALATVTSQMGAELRKRNPIISISEGEDKRTFIITATAFST